MPICVLFMHYYLTLSEMNCQSFRVLNNSPSLINVWQFLQNYPLICLLQSAN